MASFGSKRLPVPPFVAPIVALVSIWAALVGSGAFPRAARAEDAEGSALKPGAWAAEFEIDPKYRYDLGISTGATLSVKRHLSARSALRLGVSAGFDETKSDEERSYERYATYYVPTYVSDSATGEGHDENHAYALLLHFVRYHPVRDAVTMFWEIGPSLRYAESQSHDEFVYPGLSPTDPSETNSYDRSAVRREASLDLALGFEWFFNRRLSLGGRIGAFAAYGWGSEARVYGATVDDGSYWAREVLRSDPEGVSVHTEPAAIHLSAYF